MTKARKVAVIGAGPSGLAAAKSLIHDHPPGTFVPTIYERKTHVGGIWPEHSHDHANIVAPDMPTNVSKHIVSFSDLAWDSLPVDEDDDKKSSGQRNPTFPAAHQVGKYLQAYAQRYLPADAFKFGTEVVNLSYTDGSTSDLTLTSRALMGADDPVEEVFDLVVVASGFFATPSIPSIPDSHAFHGPVVHTSQLRDVDSLLTMMNGAKRIVVVGGSLSGGEAAAKVAFHLSSLRHPAEKGVSTDTEGFTVHHVTTRPFWIVPPYVPANPITDGVPNPRPTFQPLDVIFADLSRRPGSQVRFSPSAFFPPQAAVSFNGVLRSLVGTDQSELGNGALRMPPSRGEKPPWLVISPSYGEFVRSGEIETVLGRAIKIGERCMTIQTDHSLPVEMTDVGMIVMATGFTPHAALSFLSPPIRRTLEHDPNNDYDPIKLFNFSTTHPSIPSLGFVGFYRGPYFGVLEQQARFLGASWSGALSAAPRIPPEHVETAEKRGQFPMGDYSGLMESFSALLQTTPLAFSSHHAPQKEIAIPARYAGHSVKVNGQAASEQARACESMIRTLARPSLFVAPAVFRALQGRWKLSRRIDSRLSTYPSGTFIGEANMHAREPTAEGYAAEFLYIEKGELVTGTGLRMSGERSYVYRLSELEPQMMTAWFVKPGRGSRQVDYLFHTIEIDDAAATGDGSRWGKGWCGKGSHHLCVRDHYQTDYWFDFQAINVKQWGIGYTVKGPSKDYRTRATYVR